MGVAVENSSGQREKKKQRRDGIKHPPIKQITRPKTGES
jgi:hypothetical protein